MLPELPLLQLVPARATAALDRIRNQVWLPAQPLEVEWAGSGPEHVSLAKARKRPRKRITQPFFWGNFEDQAWFRIKIPNTFRDGSWHLEWKEQGESTAYVDGSPYAGLDVAHHTCRIPQGCREIWMEVMALESGIWLQPARPAITPEGCRFEAALARQRDELAWEVCHDLEVLLNLLEDEYRGNPSLRSPFARKVGYNSPLEDVSVLHRRLARLIEEAVCAFESDGLEGARKKLRSAYKALRGQPEAIRCRLTGHAHIDLVWLWTEKASEFKAVHTFATVNQLMEAYPEFCFGYSQPASYRAVGRRAPALMKQVRQRIAEGRWEAVGASEVESDTLLACGEALARNLVIGQEGFRELQGKHSEILWLPDVFGYSACLPQLMAQTGVKYFFTTKLTWGSVTNFPYSSFIWQGSDGSRILSHVSQEMGYNQTVTPAEVRTGARNYRQADIHDEFLMPSGYGDGGGGPTPEMCERARRMADLAGTPATRWGRIDAFFAGLEAVRPRLPEYQGELYLQYHRGVLTTHGDLKAAFRAAETALQAWEAAHAATAKGGINPEAWQRLVFAQFHDYIPGSSIPQVYADAVPELRRLADRAHAAATKALSRPKGKPCLFNPLPLPRRLVHRNRLVELPPLAGIPVEEAVVGDPAPVRASRTRLANGRVDARFDSMGRIRSLTVDGCKVAQADLMGTLMAYPDQPHAFEAWDIDRSTLSQGRPVRDVEFVEFNENGPSACIVFSATIGKDSRARIQYSLVADSPVLRVEYDIDWQEPQTLLKVLFPTDYNGSHARFGDPFGSSLRSQQPGKPYDEAQWEVAGSRYAVVCDDGQQEGFFAVTEAKYGWSCRGGTLGLSLLRSARMPVSMAVRTNANRGAGPEFSDLGTHRIRLAVGRFVPDSPRTESPAALAESLFSPALPYRGSPSSSGFLGMEGGSSLLPCWAKPEADGSWVLRLHETLGQRGRTRVLLEDGYLPEQVDLSGNPVKGRLRGNLLKFSPYEVVSLKISPRA